MALNTLECYHLTSPGLKTLNTMQFMSVNASWCINDRTRAHNQEMRYRNVTWCIILSLFTYLPLNYDTTVLPDYFLNNTYPLHISNGRMFMKIALRILLLSTFRVSSINYYLVCSHKICAFLQYI